MKPTNIHSGRKSFPFFMKAVAIVLCLSLFFEQTGFSQVVDTVDISGRLNALSAQFIQERFRPVHLRYLDYDNQANNFKLLLDKGDSENTSAQQLEAATKDLLKYFAIGVTLPNETFWVNLRPDSPERIIDPYLAQTDIGRIFLEADLQLKKDTALYTSPQTPEGREYWDKLYKKAEELYGYENVSIPTLTRPWIVPGEIILRETQGNAYIYKATLKVMLEQDYLRGTATYNFSDPRLKELNEYSSQLIREKIIPRLTREINNSKRYSCLRQVYYSLILAQWFKQRFLGKGGFYSWLINRKELNGLTSQQPWSPQFYFQEYQESFKDGEYNIKEQTYGLAGSTIRSYFSGGINCENIIFSNGISKPGVKLIEGVRLGEVVPVGGYAAFVKVQNDSISTITTGLAVFAQEIKIFQAGPAASTLLATSPISIAEELTRYVRPPAAELPSSLTSVKDIEGKPAVKKYFISNLISPFSKAAIIIILLFTLSFPSLAAPFLNNAHGREIVPQKQVQMAFNDRGFESGPGIVFSGTLGDENKLDSAGLESGSDRGTNTNIGKEVSSVAASQALSENFDDVDPFLSLQQEIPQELTDQFQSYREEIKKLKKESVWSLLNRVKQYSPSEKSDLALTSHIKYSYPYQGSSNPNTVTYLEGFVTGLAQSTMNILAALTVSNLNENEKEPWNVIKALAALKEKKPEVDGSLIGGFLKRMIISDLTNALRASDYKDPVVIVQLLDTLRVYNDSKGFFDGMDPRLSGSLLDKLIGHKDRWVRAGTAELLKSARKDDPNVKIRDRIMEHLPEEPDAIVFIGYLEAARIFCFDSPAAVLPVMLSAGKLQFDPSKNEVSYAAAQKALYMIGKWLDDFGKKSPESRRWVIQYFAEALKLQTDYEKINSIYLPLAQKLGIKPAEITPYLKELDPQVAKALTSIVGPAVQAQGKPAYLQEIEQRYQNMASRVKADNPLIAGEIQALKDKNSYSRLCRIVAFDQSSARKTLALDALAETETGLSFIREFLIGLTDPSVNVKAAAARAIAKNNPIGSKIIYTGKQGVLLKALKNAVNKETDRVAVGYLVDLLLKAGDKGISDAADMLRSSLESNKHPLNQIIILEAIESLSLEAGSMKEPIINILKTKLSDTETGVLMKAVEIGGKILQKYDDEALVDAIINATVDFPLNPESDTYDKLKENAVKALLNSKFALDRLEVNKQERNIRNDIKGVNVVQSLQNVLKNDTAISLSQETSISEDMKKVFNPSPEIRKDDRVKAMINIGNTLKGSANVDVTLRLLGLIGVEPDSDVCNEIFAAISRINNNGDAIREHIGGNPIVNGLKAIAKDKEGKAYALRKKAISTLGKLGARETMGALKEILNTSDENGIIFSALDSGLAQIRRGNSDTALIQTMARVFINKFDIHPETAKNYPQLNSLQRRLVWVFGQNYTIVDPILAQSLFDEETKPRESYNVGKINYIRYLRGLVKSAKLSAKRFQLSAETKSKVTNSDGVSRSTQKEKPQDKTQVNIPNGVTLRKNIPVQSRSVTAVKNTKKIEISVQQPQLYAATQQAVAGAPPPPPPKKPGISTRIIPKIGPLFQQPQLAAAGQQIAATSQGLPEEVQNAMQEWVNLPHSPATTNLIRLSQSPGALLQPAYLELARNGLEEANEEISTAAAFIYAKTKLDFIVNKPQTAPDIKGLKSKLTDPAMSFHNILFRIIGLGRQASPYSAEPISMAYYEIMEKRYPNIETKDSQREKERRLIIKAVEWALSNVNGSAVYEVRKVLESRLNQGKLNYADVMPLTFLQKYNPGEFQALINKTGIKAAPKDLFKLVSNYSVLRSHFDEEREALKLLVDGLKDVLVTSLSQEDLEKLKSSPGYFEELADTLLYDLAHPQKQAVAGHRLGELQDPRARLVLIAALSIKDRIVGINVAWALAQYETTIGQYDPAVDAIKLKLSETNDEYERAGLAFAIGSLGDPRAIGLAQGLLSDKSELVRTIAVKSAGKLLVKFKDGSLINPLLESIEKGYRDDPVSLVSSLSGITYRFSPSAEAGFDVLKDIASHAQMEPVFAGIPQKAAANNLLIRIKNIFSPDIKEEILKQCARKDCNTVYDAIRGMEFKYWLPRVVLLLSVLFLPALLIWRYARKYKKSLSDLEDKEQASIRKKFQANNYENNIFAEENNLVKPEANGFDNSGQEAIIVRELTYKECENLMSECLVLLKSPKLPVEKFSNILTNYSRILRLLPFSLKNKSRDELKRRQDFVVEVRDFIDKVIFILDQAVKDAEDEPQKDKILRYEIECVEYWYYFSLYSLGLAQMADMIKSASYGEGKNNGASVPLWLRLFGIEALGKKAIPNLAYLTEEIYKQGNALARSRLYKFPSGRKEYRSWAEQYLREAKPGVIKDSVEAHWPGRQWFSRMGGPVLGPALGAVLGPIVTYALLGVTITLGSLLAGLGVGVAAGYFVGSFAHWYYINRVWEDAINTFLVVQQRMRYYERLLHSQGILGDEVRERNHGKGMLKENEKEIDSAIYRELDSTKPASADAIFVIVGREEGNIAVVRRLLPDGHLVRDDTPVFVLDNLSSPSGTLDSGDDFLRLQLSLDPDATFGEFLESFSGKRGVSCLNKENLRVDKNKLVKKIKELRPRFITIYAAKPVNDFKATFGNAYRGTQIFYSQGLPGMVHLNADGRYIGPIWNFDQNKKLEILASWGSIKGILEQRYGLMIPDKKSGQLHSAISKLFEKFQSEPEIIAKWLRDEALSGAYDLNNESIPQMLFSTAFILESFGDGGEGDDFRKICKEANNYLEARVRNGELRLPLHATPDIIVPIILISQGAQEGDIDRYVTRYLDTYATEHLKDSHGIEVDREAARSFYKGLFMTIMNEYHKGSSFQFGMQIFYPPEVSYSRVSDGNNEVISPQPGKPGVVSEETEWDIDNMTIEELSRKILEKVLRSEIQTPDDLKQRLDKNEDLSKPGHPKPNIAFNEEVDKIVSKWNNDEPQQSRGETEQRYQKAREWLEKWLEAERLALKKLQGELEKSSSPLLNSAAASVDNELGGIDFRNLHMTGRQTNKKDILVASQAISNEPDEEWQEFNKMIQGRIVPSADRIKDYIEASQNESVLIERINKVRNCLAEILRIDEEDARPTDAIFTNLLELTEKGYSAQDFKLVFTNISVGPKEFSFR